MIEVSDLTKHYGPRTAIDKVSFSVPDGTILGLLGPNGAGKTTTMRILTGYMPPSSGVARVSGYDAFKDSLKLRSHIGYLPERVPLYEDMTVTSYLRYAGRIHGMASKRLPGRVDEVMEQCNVEEFSHRLIGKLSRGQRQRVGIAQAIVHDPEVLVLDEPTVGLDPRQIIETRALIKALGEKHTVVLSSHILPEVSALANQVVIMYEGHVVAQDSPENLAARMQGQQSLKVTVRGPSGKVRDALQQLQGVTSVEGHDEAVDISTWLVHSAASAALNESIASLVVKHGWGLRELASVNLSLEDIYLQLTTSEEVEQEGPGEDHQGGKVGSQPTTSQGKEQETGTA